MTPPLAPTLPPWPVLDEKDYGDPLFERDVYIDHLKALAAAWEARARLAVEALGEAAHYPECRPAANCNLCSALAAIGPLPPLPGLPTAEKGE